MKFRMLALLTLLFVGFNASAKVKNTAKETQETPAVAEEQPAAPTQITIQGKVQFTYDGYWDYDVPAPEFKMTVYQQEGTNRHVFAEADIDENNEYTLTLPIETPGVYTVDCGRWQSVRVWGEDEDLTINFRGYDTARVKIKNPPYVYIQGGPKNEVMNQFNFNAYRNYQTMIANSRALYNAHLADSARSGINTALMEYNSSDYKARTRFLVEHNSTLTSVLAPLASLNPDEDKELIEATLNQLEAAHPGYVPIQNYKESVATAKAQRERLNNGKPAPLFSYPQINGENLGLADLKGKIVLVDFWASWCGPCRKEIVNLKKYYEEFKDKGVEFLSVSIDASEEAWLKAAEEEEMPWLQIHATDGGKQLMTDYQFGGIPFIILVDAEGNLYAKNLRGEAIPETIQKALDGVAPEQPAPRASISMGAIAM
ncbi:MAG: redoxin domain-containing protein [Porphyromonadaceae bacterium]|nr:redoxin domain-containing protein [Porphyromonadaceae bacterium]